MERRMFFRRLATIIIISVDLTGGYGDPPYQTIKTLDILGICNAGDPYHFNMLYVSGSSEPVRL
jgi:hypothetical protein